MADQPVAAVRAHVAVGIHVLVSLSSHSVNQRKKRTSTEVKFATVPRSEGQARAPKVSRKTGPRALGSGATIWFTDTTRDEYSLLSIIDLQSHSGETMSRLFGRSQRIILSASLLIAGLLAVTVAPGGAHAQWGTCYDDPAVFLNNGAAVFLGATFRADSSSVSAINYVLHVPAGVRVTKVVYFGANKDVEKLTWTADNQANTYESETNVVAPGATFSTVNTMVVVAEHHSVSVAMGQANQDVLNHVVMH